MLRFKNLNRSNWERCQIKNFSQIYPVDCQNKTFS